MASLRERARYLAASAGWTGLLTSIISTGLLARGSLGGWEFLLIFMASFFSGAIIVEARIALLAAVGSMVASSLVTYFLLILPVVMGHIGSSALETFVSDAVLVILFKSIFPVAILASFFGGLAGALVAERFGFF